MKLLIALLTFLTIASPNSYLKVGMVNEIKPNGIIAFEDTGGYIWEIQSESFDFTIGQTILLKMNSNGTETIYDDTIEMIF